MNLNVPKCNSLNLKRKRKILLDRNGYIDNPKPDYFIRYVIIIALFFSVFACKDSAKKEKDSSLKNVYIKFAQAQINIPKNYVRKTSYNIINDIEGSSLPKSIKESNIKLMEIVQFYENRHQIYVDTANIFNRIWFQKLDHVPISKVTSQLLLGQVEQTLFKEWSGKGVQIERMKGKYYGGKNIQVIKLKFMLSSGNLSGYLHNYLISTKTQTMSINITATTGIDFSNVINSLRIN